MEKKVIWTVPRRLQLIRFIPNLHLTGAILKDSQGGQERRHHLISSQESENTILKKYGVGMVPFFLGEGWGGTDAEGKMNLSHH